MSHIVSFFDEPFADPSLVPTYFVSELARKTVTVAIAGDGGDEMFAGYEKYTTDDIENNLRNTQEIRWKFGYEINPRNHMILRTWIGTRKFCPAVAVTVLR